MNESELAVCRRRAAERDGHPPDHPDVDDVDIHFDWLVPSSAGEAITIMLDVTRGTRTNVIRFKVDLARLSGADLQGLHDLLAARPKGYQLAYDLAWLLELSLECEMPTSNLEERQQKVRELLLCSENERTHTI